MFSIKLGLKNLTRQKRRNIFTILVIAIAFFGYLYMESMMNGMEEMSFDNIKNFETGNVQVVNPAYWEEREELPLENLIHWDNELEKTIRQTQGVTGVSPELKFFANLNNGIDEMRVIGLGVIPENYNEVFQTQDYFVEGSMSVLSENKAVIGEQMAELLDLTINDYVILLVRTKEDTFNTIDVEIGGIVKTLNPVMNNRMVLVPLELTQERLNVEDSISMLSLKTSSGEEEIVIRSLEGYFQQENLPLQAYTWQESAKNVIALAVAKKSGAGAVLSVVLLIGMVDIINNIILSALERTSEIGMMKALGMKEWEIVYVFMVEATGIGVLGGLTGCILGLVGVNWVVKNGISFGFLGEDMSKYGIPILDRLYGVWNGSTFYYIFFLGIFVSILSSIIPAYWAAHKDPVEAIYHR